MSATLRIMGIDPGLITTGWGVVDVSGSRLTHVAHGECASGDGALAIRLRHLHTSLVEIYAMHQPDETAAESSFVSINAKTSLLLGHARGVAMLVSALADVSVTEYEPTVVKRTIVGTGRAKKSQVGHMVRFLFPGVRDLGNHAADALAVAVCHANHRGSPLGYVQTRGMQSSLSSGIGG